MTRLATALHRGDKIRVHPHDVFRYSGQPRPAHHCPDADVTVDAVIREYGWAVVVIWWHVGSARWVTTYDADHPIELVRPA